MELSAAYRILGLTPPVGWAQARSAWRRAAHRLHPDRGGDEVRFRQARDAWTVIDRALGTSPASTPADASVPELNLGTPLTLRELRLDGLRMPATGVARLIQGGDEVLLQVDLDVPIQKLGSWFEATLLHAGTIAASLRGPIVSSAYGRHVRGQPSRVTAFWVRPVFGPR